MVAVRQATEDDLPDVLAVYEECGYKGGVESTDTVFVAIMDGQCVGAVRLCQQHGLFVMRGMMIRKAFQRRGVGRALLATAIEWLGNSGCYCLPYQHLRSFYEKAGFKEVVLHDLPHFLIKRLNEYRTGGLDLLAMRRKDECDGF
ncbi:MAG TPA: N-acetyltransferase [Phycisphaerae bacterium]|nr:N-acetyltransferase [Phycisphaerae bacterium]